MTRNKRDVFSRMNTTTFKEIVCKYLSQTWYTVTGVPLH